MGRSWQDRIRAGWLLAVVASLALALPSPVSADEFDKALAEIDEALETNPHGVSEDSLRSCRAMRKTAILLRKMGKHARAVRRIKACRRLLGLEDYRSGRATDARFPWVA